MQARAYVFMIKRIPSDFNIFTRKNKRGYVSLPTPCIWPSLSKSYQTVTIMNLDM